MPPLQLSYYLETVYPLFAKVREACIHLRILNEETMYAASVRAGIMVKRDIWSTAFVAVLAVIAALVFSALLAERIVSPIRSFRAAARKISSGDYAVQIPVETGDELGSLAREFNLMASQLGSYHAMNIEQIVFEKTKAEAILSSIEDGMVIFDTSLHVTGINPAARRMLGLELTGTSALQCADIFPGTTVCDPMKEVERLKTEFVMAASHELRTPLASLSMSIDLLQEHSANMLGEKDCELLQVAHEEVHRMKALISDLLDLSKIEAGRIALEFESVPVQILFDKATAVFKSQLEMKEITLISELAGDLPRVRADANKITWVLTNLVSNALRYVNKGGHIELTAYRVSAHIHLSVHDDGSGIPPEYQSRIFEKFVQVKGREAGGSGLGLAICKEIVRAHGGTIWVESSRDQGSTFTFTLPLVQ